MLGSHYDIMRGWVFTCSPCSPRSSMDGISGTPDMDDILTEGDDIDYDEDN